MVRVTEFEYAFIRVVISYPVTIDYRWDHSHLHSSGGNLLLERFQVETYITHNISQNMRFWRGSDGYRWERGSNLYSIGTG